MSKCKNSQCTGNSSQVVEDDPNEEVQVQINVVQDIVVEGLVLGAIAGVAAWAIKKYI